MKKALPLILAFVILFAFGSLAGCDGSEVADPSPAVSNEGPGADNGNDDGNGDGSTTQVISYAGKADVEVVTAADGKVTYNGLTEAELDASLPCENVPEKLAAGKTVLIGYSLNQYAGDDVTKGVTGMFAEFEEFGCTTSAVEANMDANVQIGQIENFVSMGASFVQCIVSNIGTFEDVSRHAMESGTYIGFNGQTPDYICAGVVSADQRSCGYCEADIALAWIDLMYPDAGEDEIHAALLGNERNDTVRLRTFSIRDRFLEDPRTEITYYKIDSLTPDLAYSAAEEALTMDPSIRVFLTFAPSQAIGVNNYLMTLTGLEADISEYGVFTVNYDAAVFEIISAAKADPASAAIRGMVSFDKVNLWDPEFEMISGLLFGKYDTPYYVFEKELPVTSFDYA